jgi:hypothetical protein
MPVGNLQLLVATLVHMAVRVPVPGSANRSSFGHQSGWLLATQGGVERRKARCSLFRPRFRQVEWPLRGDWGRRQSFRDRLLVRVGFSSMLAYDGQSPASSGQSNIVGL